MKTETIRALIFLALAKIAGKESRRELIEAGKAHAVDLSVSGKVDGLTFRGEKIAGTLAIGHESTRSSSSAAPPAEVVAYFLGLLPRTKRARILEDLPKEFLDQGGKLPVDPDRLAEAEGLLERLRSRKDQTVAGAVTWSYAA